MTIAIIDYGMGNLRSVEKALHFVGATDAFVTSDSVLIESADKAVLPGDGAFDATVESLRASGIEQAVKDFVATGRPFLGICIGMQVLMTLSEEGRAGVVGLDLAPGRVKRFPSRLDDGEKLNVPLIGWNTIHPKPGSRLFAGVGDTAWAYFLHSYYCVPDDPTLVTATASYGLDYCAALESGNLMATQFHPEKSGDAGLQILRNFASM